jgi:hypothetical protein
MSRNAFGTYSRLHVIRQGFKAAALAEYGLVLPLAIRIPAWAWIACGVLALLRATIPQASDRLAWWKFLLRTLLLRLPARQGYPDQNQGDADQHGHGDTLTKDQHAERDRNHRQ